MKLKRRRKRMFIETVTAISHNTDTDFGADTLSDTVISGSGSGAVVQLDPSSTSGDSTKAPSGVSEEGSGNTWGSPNNSVDADNDTMAQANTGSAGTWSKYLVFSGVNSFAIPADAVVEGVEVRAILKTNTSTCPVEITVGSYTKTDTVTDTKTTFTFGGSSDLWGGLSSSPSFWNSATDLTLKLRFQNGTIYCNIYEMLDVKIYYKTYSGLTGTLTSSEISVPAGTIKAWHQLTVNDTKPADTTIVYDILKASDDSVLLSNQTAPVDLSGLALVNLKVRAELATTNYSNNPSVDNFQVTAKKMWLF